MRALRILTSTAMVSVSVLLLSGDALAARTVQGTITDKNGDAAANVRVKAIDDDPWPNPDDLMGQDMTAANGSYAIHYAGGHWDSAPHWWTIWRPDIFIRVSAPVNGWCEDGKWNDNKNFIHLQDSGVTSNHKLRNDLTKNLALTDFPLPDVASGTFTLGSNMHCEVKFFLWTSCFACTAAGDKISWDEFGLSGVPRTRSRCDLRPLPQCTAADRAKISDLDAELSAMPLPTDRAALYYEAPVWYWLAFIAIILGLIYAGWRVIRRKSSA